MRSGPRAPDALAESYRLLARRPLTTREIEQRLAARGHDAVEIAAARGHLERAGHLDDARLALDFVTTRAERLAEGPLRLIEALEARGVAREIATAAIELAIARGEIDLAQMIGRRLKKCRRGAVGPLDGRAYARVYNALLRAGFDEAAIRREIDPLRRDEAHDDFA